MINDLYITSTSMSGSCPLLSACGLLPTLFVAVTIVPPVISKKALLQGSMRSVARHAQCSSHLQLEGGIEYWTKLLLQNCIDQCSRVMFRQAISMGQYERPVFQHVCRSQVTYILNTALYLILSQLTER